MTLPNGPDSEPDATNSNVDGSRTDRRGRYSDDELLAYGTESRFVLCERSNPRAWICTDTVYELDQWR